MTENRLTKEEYLALRATKSRSEVRLALKIGPIRFDQMLEEIGIDLENDRAQRVNRKKAN